MRAHIARLAIAATLLTSLAACELRNDGNEEPAATETPAVDETALPEVNASQSPVASIIRDDARSEELHPPVQALELTIPFGDSGNDIGPEALTILREVLDSDALGEGWPVTLRGHTDSSGNDSANLRASRARAEAVAAWLVERGVDDERIEVIAFGEQNPIAPNANPDGTPNEEGRTTNRRVDIEIAPETPVTPPTAAEDDEDA